MHKTLRQSLLLSAALHVALFAVYRPQQPTLGAGSPMLSVALVGDAASATGISRPATPNRTFPAAAHAHTENLETSALRHTRQPRRRDITHVATRTSPEPAASPHAPATVENGTPPAVSTTSINGANLAAARARIESQLLAALREHFSYPLLARRNGWQGQVRLQLRIEPDGRLSHVQLARTSGYALLDQTALDATRHIRLSEAVVAGLQGQPLDLLLPVEYRLVDG